MDGQGPRSFATHEKRMCGKRRGLCVFTPILGFVKPCFPFFNFSSLPLRTMNYKVIAGTFHVKGYAPDGDSIRFQANDPAHWAFFDSVERIKSRRQKAPTPHRGH